MKEVLPTIPVIQKLGAPHALPFGWIAPTSMLSFIPEEASFHLILAHLLVDPGYVAFYKQKIERGDTVVLDNSAFEFGRALSAEEIFKLIDDSGIEPTYVVAPDYPGQSWDKTWISTVEFLDKCEALNKPYKIMAVPQSVKGDFLGWLECYDRMMDEPKIEMIGMSILGIPNAFCSLTGTDDIAFNRIFAAQYIVANTKHMPGTKWHHFLGLGAGPRELIIQQQIGLIDSNDSSSPIWHGHLGIQYDDSQSGLVAGKSRHSVDFDATPTAEFLPMISSNIEYMKQILSGSLS